MAPDTAPRVAAIGLVTWDRLLSVDSYPAPGRYAVVRETRSAPGGTTANSAVCLARLGAQVAICALVGEDAEGHAIRAALESEGIDTHWLVTVHDRPTDTATIVVSAEPPDRTIYCHQGARLARGDRLDIAAIFAHDIVLLDADHIPLRRFLLDLPAHTVPGARLLGTLKDLAEASIDDALDLLLRHDTVTGNERELLTITGCRDLDSAIDVVQRRMPGATLRSAFVTLGPRGAVGFTRDNRFSVPGIAVRAIDTTGAGDAFAGGIAFGLARRWPPNDALVFANAVAALSTTALGAQTALPTWCATCELLQGVGWQPPR